MISHYMLDDDEERRGAARQARSPDARPCVMLRFGPILVMELYAMVL